MIFDEHIEFHGNTELQQLSTPIGQRLRIRMMFAEQNAAVVNTCNSQNSSELCDVFQEFTRIRSRVC